MFWDGIKDCKIFFKESRFTDKQKQFAQSLSLLTDHIFNFQSEKVKLFFQNSVKKLDEDRSTFLTNFITDKPDLINTPEGRMALITLTSKYFWEKNTNALSNIPVLRENDFDELKVNLKKSEDVPKNSQRQTINNFKIIQYPDDEKTQNIKINRSELFNWCFDVKGKGKAVIKSDLWLYASIIPTCHAWAVEASVTYGSLEANRPDTVDFTCRSTAESGFENISMLIVHVLMVFEEEKNKDLSNRDVSDKMKYLLRAVKSFKTSCTIYGITNEKSSSFLNNVKELDEETGLKLEISEEPKVEKANPIGILLQFVEAINARIASEKDKNKKDIYNEELIKAYSQENASAHFISHLMLLHSFALKHVSANLAEAYYKDKDEPTVMSTDTTEETEKDLKSNELNESTEESDNEQTYKPIDKLTNQSIIQDPIEDQKKMVLLV